MSWGEDGGVGVGEAFRAVPPPRGVRVPWIDRWVLTAVHGTPGVDGGASAGCWRLGGVDGGSVPSGGAVDPGSCWSTPPSGPQCSLSAAMVRVEVGAGAGGAGAPGDCGCGSTPGL